MPQEESNAPCPCLALAGAGLFVAGDDDPCRCSGINGTAVPGCIAAIISYIESGVTAKLPQRQFKQSLLHGKQLPL